MTQSTSGRQARLLGGLLVVPEGARRSELDRLRVETNLVDLLVPARVLHEQGDLDAVVDV